VAPADQPGDDDKPLLQCFNCGKVGHFARKFREPRAKCEQQKVILPCVRKI